MVRKVHKESREKLVQHDRKAQREIKENQLMKFGYRKVEILERQKHNI